MASVSHAAVTTAMGIARDETISIVNSYEKSEGFRDFMDKHGDRATTYFLWDVVGNIAFDLALPALGVQL